MKKYIAPELIVVEIEVNDSILLLSNVGDHTFIEGTKFDDWF